MTMQSTAPEALRDAPAVAALGAWLNGELIRPGDERYDATRALFDARFDRRPALIVRASGASDVIRAVDFAREQALPLAIRSGGHGLAGHGMVDGGVVVDLSGLQDVRLDPQRRLARLQPGVTSGLLAASAQPHGLALTTGDSATVAVGGLVVGGGIGLMSRKYGLTIDHLLSAEVVTADGRLLRASADEHPDLFWALRGGGGNFGIITSLEFALHEVGTVLGGAVFFSAAEGARVLRGYADYALQAPEELTTILAVMQAPPLPFIPAERHGELVLAVLVCCVGDLDQGQRAVAPLRALGTPIADVTAPMPYPALFQLTQESTRRGRQHAIRSMFTRAVDDALIATILEHAARRTSPLGMVQIRALGGEMARVPADATAFAHRDQPFMLTIINSWEDPGQAPRHAAWTLELFEALRPRASGAYVNFLGDDGAQRLRSAYSSSAYARLTAVKRAYDPTNFFAVNHNIAPSA